MKGDLILVGLGPYARAKYIPLIENAVAGRLASDFHVVELESARDGVNAFFRVAHASRRASHTSPICADTESGTPVMGRTFSKPEQLQPRK